MDSCESHSRIHEQGTEGVQRQVRHDAIKSRTKRRHDNENDRRDGKRTHLLHSDFPYSSWGRRVPGGRAVAWRERPHRQRHTASERVPISLRLRSPHHPQEVVLLRRNLAPHSRNFPKHFESLKINFRVSACSLAKNCIRGVARKIVFVFVFHDMPSLAV